MKQYSETICDTVINDWTMIPDNLKAGKVLLNKKGRPIARKGGWCKIYKCEIDGNPKALRLWLNEMNEKEMAERSQAISEFILTHQSKYLINFEYIPEGYMFNGETYPIILMDWCQGRTMKQYISDCIEDNDTESILTLARQFLEMTNELHSLGISHGDLQHDNIMITEDGSLKLVDYDSMFVPALKGSVETIKGKAGYQHPTARDKNKYLQPYTDYFSELMIFLTLYLVGHKPDLWDSDKVNDDDKEDQLLFKITEVTDSQNIYCDWEIKGVPALFGGLQMALLATDLKALSPLSSYVDAANIYPKKRRTTPPITHNSSSADIPDNLFK